MTNSIPVLFFVDQPTSVVERFRDWFKGTPTQCVVVEPIARAFSLVVRDNPWGVVLNIESEVGLRLCSQIREDDLLGSVKIIALSTGSSTRALTAHMFGDSSADVYGKLPLENGIVDVWLNKQLQMETSIGMSGFNQSDDPTTLRTLETENIEIELTSKLSVSAPKSRTPSIDERVSRLELELFEQSEKLTSANRNVLKSQLRLRDSTDQNAMLQAECTRLSSVLSGGTSDAKLQQEVQRLYDRIRIAEETIERSQQQTVDISLQSVDSLSPQDLLRQITNLRHVRDEKVEQINTLHGELQLTRQAVETLQRRTKKSESRLAEVQDLGQSREQLMQREFVGLQRQVSNGTRSLEIANHRGVQFQHQVNQLQVRLTEIEHLHQEERTHWLQESQDVTLTAEKEAGLLLEIEGLTDALQAQLMGEADQSGEAILLHSQEQRVKQVMTDLMTTQQQLQQVTEYNTQLIGRLSEKQETHAHQGMGENSGDVISRMDYDSQMAAVAGDHDLQVAALEERISKMSRLSSSSSRTREDSTDVIQRLQLSLAEFEQDREDIEAQLIDTKRQVAQLEDERVQLQRSLEDSKAMADAVEEATDNELEVKEQQVLDAKVSLDEQVLSYQELELQTAMAISERDELWAKVDPLQQRQSELETQLTDVEVSRQTLREQVTSHQEQVHGHEKIVDELHQQIQGIEQDLSDSANELETLKIEADEVKEARDGYDALEAENQALSEQRQTLLEELKGVETVLEAQRIEVQAFHETINSIEVQKTALQSEKEALLLDKESIIDRIDSFEKELASTQDMLNRVTQEKEVLESTIVTLNAQIETLKADIQNSVETSAKASVDQRDELEQQHRETVADQAEASEKERTVWRLKLEELERQILSDKVRESLEQSEQVVELEQELKNVRSEMHSKKEEIIRLETQLQLVQVENTRLSNLEIELQTVQSTCDSLEDALHKVRTELSDAQSSWDVEREMLDDEQTQQAHGATMFTTLEEELQTVREQRSQLLETIDMLTKVQISKNQSIQELQGSADGVVVQLQEERDEAQTELEMMRLEMGIAQSTARQLAQQAERIRRDVLNKQEIWSQKLTQKEAENARLRDKLNSVERGLSSLFVQRPVF